MTVRADAEGLIVHDGRQRASGAARFMSCLKASSAAAGHRALPHDSPAASGASASRALAVNPDFIVCDEAVSALDAPCRRRSSTCWDLQKQRNISYLFIAHDLGRRAHQPPRGGDVLGHIVEIATRKKFTKTRATPTRARCSIGSSVFPTPNRIASLEGEPPSPSIAGCRLRRDARWCC
jgi:ABC-type dipeptide/oligopeptide/nickel transport system ATPase component